MKKWAALALVLAMGCSGGGGSGVIPAATSTTATAGQSSPPPVGTNASPQPAPSSPTETPVAAASGVQGDAGNPPAQDSISGTWTLSYNNGNQFADQVALSILATPDPNGNNVRGSGTQFVIASLALGTKKNCSKGIPCGNTCISRSYTCHIGGSDPLPAPIVTPSAVPSLVPTATPLATPTVTPSPSATLEVTGVYEPRTRVLKFWYAFESEPENFAFKCRTVAEYLGVIQPDGSWKGERKETAKGSDCIEFAAGINATYPATGNRRAAGKPQPSPTPSPTPAPTATPNSSPTPSPTVRLSSDVQPIFTANCTTSGCHTGGTPAGGMNLTSGQTFTNTVDINAQGGPGKRVVPNNPDGSILVQKLGTSPPFGSRMPLGQTPLTQAQINVIRNWIQQGAQNN